MSVRAIGNPNEFSVEYEFFDDSHDTEISMYVEGKNILAFERAGEHLTTRWDLDELAEWLRHFIDEMAEDPYPVDCEGQYAAEKDETARDFDPDDDEEFDAYYDALDEWDWRHRWHPASSGAILADVYFQLVGDNVEISWNNEDAEEGVQFQCQSGGARIPRSTFYTVMDRFLKEYAEHWFS